MSLRKVVESGKSRARRIILPRPRSAGHQTDHEAPLVVAGMFQTRNGIGRAAQLCYDALCAEGLSPLAVDLSEAFGQAESPASVPLSAIPKSRTGTVLLFANAPETERALTVLGLRRWHQWSVIGCWAWELGVAPKQWSRAACHLTSIWAPSRFVQTAFQQIQDTQVQCVPHHVALPSDTNRKQGRFDRPDGVTQVVAIADGRSSFRRKNILGAVDIFRNTFPNAPDVHLLIKCRNLDMFPAYHSKLRSLASEDSRIRLISSELCEAEQQSLIHDSDIILSAHRAEGFGLVLAEAMAAGRAVVATGWSGNMDFMTPDSAMLLPYNLVPVEDPDGAYLGYDYAKWAEPDMNAATEMLRALHDNAELRTDLGKAARQTIERRLPRSVYAQALANLSTGTLAASVT